MEENINNQYADKSVVSILNFVLLQIFYWCIYMWILPKIVIQILIQMKLDIPSVLINSEFLTYLISMIIALFLSRTLLKKEFHLEITKMAYTLLVSLSIMVFINIVFSLLIMLMNGPTTSINQSGLDSIAGFGKWRFITMVVIFAPIFEELVFRGGIYRFIRVRKNFLFAAFISSFLFGFVHVMSSLLIGQYNDLIYLFLYAGLGFILAYAYEYNKSIYACIILHMAYNFMGCATLFFS
ncbi:MAG: CPBP family intramembrane metalloprotease [Erysipelotrichia bacterium]|nr:CPBP family intramembrane metalloprotease [Erysipelotrichia bacterium]